MLTEAYSYLFTGMRLVTYGASKLIPLLTRVWGWCAERKLTLPRQTENFISFDEKTNPFAAIIVAMSCQSSVTPGSKIDYHLLGEWDFFLRDYIASVSLTCVMLMTVFSRKLGINRSVSTLVRRDQNFVNILFVKHWTRDAKTKSSPYNKSINNIEDITSEDRYWSGHPRGIRIDFIYHSCSMIILDSCRILSYFSSSY